MRRRSTRPLVLLNVVLLAMVVVFAVVPRAGADADQPERARGAYTMVSGSIQGGSNDVVYIIDSANQELIALGWNVSRNDILLIGYRNLVSDARQRSGR